MKKPDNRIASLDGLRTISIILVIVGHLFHVIGLGDLGNLGNLGVRVFFVISGFLITGLLVKEMDRSSTIDLLKFYFRRTLRIFPPFYFYLLVILIAGLVGVITVPPSSVALAGFYVTDYINPQNWYLGHTWSLAVEEQFYLLLPGLILLCGIRYTKWVLIAIVIVLPFVRVADFHISGSEQIWVLKGFHANSDALAIGCLLTLFRTKLHGSGLYGRFLNGRLVAILPLIILAFNFQYEHPNIFYGLSISAMNISIALCLDWAVVNSESAVGRILNSRPMVTLGVMSYSIYLWQQPFFNPDAPGIFTRFPFNFIGMTLMAVISYYLVERYSLRLRETLEKYLFSPRTTPNSDPVKCPEPAAQ